MTTGQMKINTDLVAGQMTITRTGIADSGMRFESVEIIPQGAKCWIQQAKAFEHDYEPADQLAEVKMVNLKAEIEYDILLRRQPPTRDHVEALFLLYGYLDQIKAIRERG